MPHSCAETGVPGQLARWGEHLAFEMSVLIPSPPAVILAAGQNLRICTSRAIHSNRDTNRRIQRKRAQTSVKIGPPAIAA